jgi:hypothetical protein
VGGEGGELPVEWEEDDVAEASSLPAFGCLVSLSGSEMEPDSALLRSTTTACCFSPRGFRSEDWNSSPLADDEVEA